MTMRQVLVVDDRQENRYLLRAMLKGNGYDAAEAANGAEALDIARRNPPDLLITDILMPVMDGFALCREWKSDQRLRAIPLIFYTATYTDERDREFALALGAEQFIVKPQEPDVFMGIIRETIEQMERHPSAQVDSGPGETTYLKQYNEVLIRKLEAKLEQLERTNRSLEQDMAVRQAAEESLRESEERLRLLLESAPEGILVQSGGRLIYVNPAMARLYGTSDTAELLGTDAIERVAPEYREAVRERIRIQHDTGNPVPPMEQEYLRMDGTRVPVETVAVPVHFEGREACLVFVRDVAERRHAEAERRRLITAIEQAGEIVCVMDTGFVMQYVNPAFEKATGYTRQEAVGQSVCILESDPRQPCYAQLIGTVSAGRCWQGRMVNRRRDGTLYTEEGTVSPVRGTDGGIVNYVAISHDITEQLRSDEEKARLEEQLRQAQKVEAIGRLAAGVAHDFNNMLSIILGYGEVMLQQLRRDDPLRDSVAEIVAAGRRSSALTRQLLAFSRRQALCPEVLDLNAIIANIEKMLHRLIGEDIIIVLRLSDSPAPVEADPGQIEQVIMNLAVNARDAMPAGGKLIIETASVELDGHYCEGHIGVAPGKYVVMAMTDTGHGMDRQTLSQIFEPFFTLKDKGDGTGLGLATVYGIVKQSGGNICVYSEPGHGTTFKVYLPRTQATPGAKDGTALKQESRGEGELILVVEDEAALRKLAQTILTRLNYRVAVADNGGMALMLMEEQGLRPDLVITDVVMPGMSGTVLVERLRKEHPDLKVLYMSGYTDNAIVQHGILEQGVPFIQKPFIIRELSAKVLEVLHGR